MAGPNKHKRKRLSIDYLDRCIDGAAKHASKNEAEISRLAERVKALEEKLDRLGVAGK